jgi:phage-related minor tail protein
MKPQRILNIIARIEADMARLSQAVASVQRVLKDVASELKENGEKVETLQATQRLLAGQFKPREGTMYGIGRAMPAREKDGE